MINDDQLNGALVVGQSTSKAVGQVLVEEGLISPRDLATALSIHLRVPLIDLKRHEVRPEALRLVPEEVSRKYNVIPFDIIGGSLALVMEDTRNLRAIDDIAAISRMRIEPMMGFADEISSAIDLNYGEQNVLGAPPVEETLPLEEEPSEIESDDEEAPALRTLNLLMLQAVRRNASDIHIEPQEKKLQVRLRVDGVLHNTKSLPLDVHAALISRIKIISGMNIAEHRRPQDGRFSRRIRGEEIDVRVACGSTVNGEMAVLRILPKTASLMDLTALGFTPDALKTYEQMLKLPFGMILLGGPTGSGKTTTLYASINRLNMMERNIMTIEDPVEYHIKGVNQFQVNVKAGVTFADGLRAFMRLDPDIILVGEVRDAETARMAMQAAFTGHLVFSSVHANDAVGIMFRLLDLGVEPFFLCSALVGNVAQRTVRRICPYCKEIYKPVAEELSAYEAEVGELPAQFYKGSGCNLCMDTGYLGRIGLFEVLVVTEDIKRLLINNAPPKEIHERAIQDGMVTLMRDGMTKVKEGITTIAEVMRNVYSITE